VYKTVGKLRNKIALFINDDRDSNACSNAGIINCCYASAVVCEKVSGNDGIFYRNSHLDIWKNGVV